MPEPNSASITLAKLQNPVKQGFDRVTEGLKKVYAGHNKYGKALDKVTDNKAAHTKSLTNTWAELSYKSTTHRVRCSHLPSQLDQQGYSNAFPTRRAIRRSFDLSR